MTPSQMHLPDWQEMDAAPEQGTRLCSLDAINASGAKGIDFENGDKRFSLFLVMAKDSKPRAYVNRCPHAGTPLEIFPDRFLTRGRDAIVCASHGARFRIEDGLCTSGPCAGKHLTKIPIETIGSNAYIARAQNSRGSK
ncbi:MAG: Rieske 2Fe-2S domain-containing protein [Hyphomicrobiales bacterium]|nr:Rieske 2Fe-2S domain-containing protein [Hyphomicrobiales bacterium]MCY4052742.1 Rieske 2Fe-2S domain-containing protein [Hyphomicrobiales bacterium]